MVAALLQPPVPPGKGKISLQVVAGGDKASLAGFHQEGMKMGIGALIDADDVLGPDGRQFRAPVPISIGRLQV